MSVIGEIHKGEPRNREWRKERWRQRGMKEGRKERERERKECKKFGGAGEKKDNQKFCILSLNYL